MGGGVRFASVSLVSIEAKRASHPALSTKWLDWVANRVTEGWPVSTNLIQNWESMAQLSQGRVYSWCPSELAGLHDSSFTTRSPCQSYSFMIAMLAIKKPMADSFTTLLTSSGVNGQSDSLWTRQVCVPASCPCRRTHLIYRWSNHRPVSWCTRARSSLTCSWEMLQLGQTSWVYSWEKNFLVTFFQRLVL